MNVSTAEQHIWKNSFRTFFHKYKHGLLQLYFLIYFPWFHWLEKTVTSHFHTIHMEIDDMIPFIEYFIVPYFFWFAYVAFAIFYFFFKNKSEYYRLCAFLFIGMTVFLIISTVYPNGHYLRPASFERDNIFTDMVRFLYKTDTPTNLFPSIHVYNSVGVNIAVWHSENFKKNKPVRYGSFLIMTSIILSTVFLKQHSVFDVITGIVLSVFLFTLVYSNVFVHIRESRTALQNRLRRV